MTTSGTSSFNLDLTELVEEAFERASGGERELRSGYDFRTARRSLNLMFAEWASRGLNMWTVEQGAINLVPGQAVYDLPENTVDLIEHSIRNGNSGQTDLSLSRISVSTYATIPNKTAQGRPVQVYVDRQIVPRVTVWPVPDDSTPYTLIYWRLRRIEDAGGGVNTQDIPFRFLPCLVAGLAYYIAQKIPEGAPRLGPLKQEYEEAWIIASTEDREKATLRLTPRIYRA